VLIFIHTLLQSESGNTHAPFTLDKALVSPLLEPVPCIGLENLGGFLSHELLAAARDTAMKIR